MCRYVFIFTDWHHLTYFLVLILHSDGTNRTLRTLHNRADYVRNTHRSPYAGPWRLHIGTNVALTSIQLVYQTAAITKGRFSPPVRKAVWTERRLFGVESRSFRLSRENERLIFHITE